MAKYKKIIVAGPLVKECIYTMSSRHDSPQARGSKKKLSTEAQQRMNDVYSWQKLEMLLAANFLSGDLVVVLTYDDAHLPKNRAEAQACVKYFRAKLAKERRAVGQELVMFWNEEHFHQHKDELQDKRWHHHAVINSTGADYESLARAWTYGKVLIAPLKVDAEKNYTTLARYMCKESRDKPGQRSWSYTRNAKKPEVETFRVPDDTQIAAPRGSIVLEDAKDRTQYGVYQYIKYISMTDGKHAHKRARRRRKR